jgi:dihydroorotate dehydrogenase (NAD+) catalytic subunit
MLIDIKNKRPYLGAKKGGLTGPAILPIAIRCIYEIFEAVDIPILGMGGVTTASDVVQLMMAGATLVGVGTATYTKGMKVYGELCKELSDWMEKEGVKNLTEIIGVAHH